MSVTSASMLKFPATCDNTKVFVVYTYRKKPNKMQQCIKFKVCKSVHHRTIQINHQIDVTIFQFIILTLIYSSTCFGRSPAHHQELNDCKFIIHLL